MVLLGQERPNFFTIDLQQKEKMNTFTIGCITNYGMGVHKPKSIRIAVSDDNKSYRDVTGLNYTPEEIFREGTYIEDLSMDMKGTEARYIRVTVNGAGNVLPTMFVRDRNREYILMRSLLNSTT